jgi:putative membrane protein
MHLLIRFLVNAIALYLIAKYVPGYNHATGFGTALFIAFIFGIVNALLGPILRLISLPLTIVTLGLFSIVVNYILFVIAIAAVHDFRGPDSTWLTNLYGAIIMMLVSTIMSSLTRQDGQEQKR